MMQPVPLGVLAGSAIRGMCPACGSSTLFSGVIAFSPKCTICGLDFDRFDVGDGPAAFLILIVGAIVTIGAVIVQVRYAPPFWVHVLLWLPLAVILVIGMLRIAKALLLHLEYRQRVVHGPGE